MAARGPCGSVRAAVTALVVLLSMTATSGCLGVDVGAWWDNEGTVRILLAPIGPDASDVASFRNLSLVVWSVGLRVSANLPTGEYYVESREFHFDPPLVIEFAENATKGLEVPLVETRLETRAVREVHLRVTVNESKLTGGRTVTGCFAGQDAERPCVRIPRAGTYTITEPAFAPERGGSATFVVPMGVHFSTGSGEYFLRAETGRLRAT